MRDVRPGLDGALGDRGHRFIGRPIRVIQDDDERLTLNLVAVSIVQHRLLRGFVQDDDDKPCFRSQLPLERTMAAAAAISSGLSGSSGCGAAVFLSCDAKLTAITSPPQLE